MRDDVRTILLGPARAQFDGLTAILSDFDADAVVADSGVVGATLLKLAPRTRKVNVVIIGVFPMSLTSRDTAPFGPGLRPGRGRAGRTRDALLRWFVPKVILRNLQRFGAVELAAAGCPPPDRFVMDIPAHTADAFLQTTVEAFEYPRSDLPPTVQFVGPVLPSTDDPFDAPGWWAELDEDRPVVHVTQGTLDNFDLDRLVRPTIDALAGDDVLVVATTGGRDLDALRGPLPTNARVERFIPHQHLLGKVDVMVTNGGYGGVHQALAHGVPLVVGGDSEDKPEVAARVAWSGTGIDLRSGRPGSRRIGAAVRRVLREPEFSRRAASLSRDIAAHRPLEEIETVLDAVSGGARRTAPDR